MRPYWDEDQGRPIPQSFASDFKTRPNKVGLTLPIHKALASFDLGTDVSNRPAIQSTIRSLCLFPGSIINKWGLLGLTRTLSFFRPCFFIECLRNS
jgi:hypothetical protein